MGLEVNPSKCEFYTELKTSNTVATEIESRLPGIKRVNKSCFNLLGAPIFPEGVANALSEKLACLNEVKGRVENLSSHVALTLLRSCLSMPKLTYLLRTAPTWHCQTEVALIDLTLKQILEGVLNVDLNESQWQQASLPVRFGGLGVRKVQDVGICAFLGSAYGVRELVAKIIDISEGDLIQTPIVLEAINAWMMKCPQESLPEIPESQKGWDEPSCKNLFDILFLGAAPHDVARLKAVSQQESGAWLHALPSVHLGTCLDNDTLRIAAALRLGCRICESHRCICGSTVLPDGHHGLSCFRCAGRLSRHHALNDLIQRALVSAGIPSVLEPPGLCRADGKRPDGLTLIPWSKGRSLLWDATCVCTYASSHLSSTTRSAGAAAENAAKLKHVKYSVLEPQYEFTAFAVESAGPWCAEAKNFIKEIGRRLRDKGCDPRSGSFLVQRISLAIQRGNAAGIMGTFGPSAVQGGIFD